MTEQTITDFLAARLREDEDTARAASPGPWLPNAEHDEVHAADGVPVCEGFALSSSQLRNTVDFVASHDPARALREVAAHRALLDVYQHAMDTHDILGDGFTAVERAVLALAAVYSDHPDWSTT